MLDIISTYTALFKYVRDWNISPFGMRSDQSAVKTLFMDRSIKFKSLYEEHRVIDWKQIQEVNEI